MAEQEYRRTTPLNELDLALMTTDAVWGRPDVPPELREALARYFKVKTQDGQEGYTMKSLWGLLGFYTRDMRLSNLNYESLKYCEHYINLAGDCLHENLIRPFIIALSRSATILELSQSRGGFLRKRLSTITSEQFKEEREPPKRNFFGGKKQKGDY